MGENKDLHFKGQQANEIFICFFRHHWISLLREFVYFIIFLTITSLVLLKTSEIEKIIHDSRELRFLFISGFLVGTIYIHRFFMKLFNHYLSVSIITDRRIIDHKKTLFFTDTMDAIDMNQIQNIERVGEGLLPNLLKYGDIKIYLSSSAAFRTLDCVPNDKFHFRCITRQKEALQQQLQERQHLGINTHEQILEQLHTTNP
ncbi:MAG: PH domain-containing protein [Candidatus Peregrinibacteria bacterium]|nr:PH domain-containing protein [Candidatus Peregrinibacteria bacterium]